MQSKIGRSIIWLDGKHWYIGFVGASRGDFLTCNAVLWNTDQKHAMGGRHVVIRVRKALK